MPVVSSKDRELIQSCLLQDVPSLFSCFRCKCCYSPLWQAGPNCVNCGSCFIGFFNAEPPWPLVVCVRYTTASGLVIICSFAPRMTRCCHVFRIATGITTIREGEVRFAHGEQVAAPLRKIEACCMKCRMGLRFGR